MSHLEKTRVLMLSAVAFSACKSPAVVDSSQSAPLSASGVTALKTDKLFSKGTSAGVVLQIATHLESPKSTQPLLLQRLQLIDQRSQLVFQSTDSAIAAGTQLRFAADTTTYLLADNNARKYWQVDASQIGSLLEGGPTMQRHGFTLSITPTNESMRLHQMKATRAELTLSFQLLVGGPSRASQNSVKQVHATITVWHTQDPKLSPKWKNLMWDFLTMPMQSAGDDKNGKWIQTLKQQLGFPLKWRIAAKHSGHHDSAEQAPVLSTAVTSLRFGALNHTDFSIPPAGYAPAQRPFQFADGQQLVSPQDLSKLTPESAAKPTVPQTVPQ